MTKGKVRLPAKLQPWLEAHQKYRLIPQFEQVYEATRQEVDDF